MHVIIMAGGSGTRFWPRSRQKNPKQLLQILGDNTLIQETIRRIEPLAKPDQIFIVSTESQIDAIKEQLPQIQSQNIIIEPRGKNTAPCIGLAAVHIRRQNPDALMAVLPADHHISNEQKFRDVMQVAHKVALEQDCLVTIGIHPTFPSTGYGYIQMNSPLAGAKHMSAFHVKTFAEKPDLHTAERFLVSGDFLWNSGMFIWKVSTILREIELALPELYDGLVEIEKYLGTNLENEVINKIYCQIRSISIDYGVMEHTKNVVVIKGEFGWSDVGTWDEVYKLLDKDKHGNVLIGEHHIVKSGSGCLIDSPDKMVAVVGLDDVVVVETDDAVLVCHRNAAQEVKDVVEHLQKKEKNQYL
ncbi:mannose-1-phosphate guanylyltransferase [candidate division KSB1 bacterium]|nr:mannose-1-phosphate guanylyltransferase [candidate division KSB1 bacterium]